MHVISDKILSPSKGSIQSYEVISPKKLNAEEHGDVFFCGMPFYGEAMYMRNMEISFFVVCPLRNCECKAPKIGMNCNQSLIILFTFDSSRFSGQTSRIYTGIPKKDIPMFHAKKGIAMLRKRFLSPITLKRSAGVIC